MTDAATGSRVLVLAPTHRDALVTESLLRTAALPCMICNDAGHLAEEAARGAGALLITDHALAQPGIRHLIQVLGQQPDWSDLACIMLLHGGTRSADGPEVLGALKNVTLLERPVSMRSLLSTVQAAVRARQRQYVLRDRVEQLRQSERLYRTIGESIDYGVWICDAEGRNTYVSPSFLKLVGMTQEECSAFGWSRALHPDDAERTMDAWRQCVKQGGVWDVVQRFRGVDGQWHPILARGLPIRNDAGHIVGWAGINLDISRQKRAEAEREQLLESERNARAEAERAGRMKDEFLATLSHELRTPLTAILGWAQMLRRQDGSPQLLANGVEVIERNARLQASLIEDLLDMSRIISGKLRLDFKLVEIVGIVQAALDSVQPTADAKGVSLVRHVTATRPVLADPSRLQQILWNLLTNAIKFTPKGGRVTVNVAQAGSHVEMGVADTGVGIKPEFLPYVFERFRQADASTTRTHGGLGLGLAIVKHLTELHGGTIHVASEGAGQGATFTVRIPVATMQRAPAASIVEPTPDGRAAASADGAMAGLDGLRVLIVDDDADSRELVCRLLTECHAQAMTAGSAAEALSALEQQPFNVLVSDIGMPGVDGYSLMRSVRALPGEAGRIPAIALTAFARSEDRAHALRVGFQAHLVKPIEPTDLVRLVARLAGRVGSSIQEAANIQ